MAAQDAGGAAAAQVPHLDLSVLAGGGEQAVVGGERERGDAALMRLEGALQARGVGGPKPHRARGAAAGDGASAGREAERARSLALAAPAARQTAGIGAPQLDGAVLAGRDQERRGAGAGHLHGAVLGLEHGRRLHALGDVEQRHRAALARCRELVAIAGEGQRRDRRLLVLEDTELLRPLQVPQHDRAALVAGDGAVDVDGERGGGALVELDGAHQRARSRRSRSSACRRRRSRRSSAPGRRWRRRARGRDGR